MCMLATEFREQNSLLYLIGHYLLKLKKNASSVLCDRPNIEKHTISKMSLTSLIVIHLLWLQKHGRIAQTSLYIWQSWVPLVWKN